MLQTLELLEKVNESIGWHGIGDNDTEQFYCEHCKATHIDYTKIHHTDTCIVTNVREAIVDWQRADRLSGVTS